MAPPLGGRFPRFYPHNEKQSRSLQGSDVGILPPHLPPCRPFFPLPSPAGLQGLGESSSLPWSSFAHLARSWDPPTWNCCGPSALCWCLSGGAPAFRLDRRPPGVSLQFQGFRVPPIRRPMPLRIPHSLPHVAPKSDSLGFLLSTGRCLADSLSSVPVCLKPCPWDPAVTQPPISVVQVSRASTVVRSLCAQHKSPQIGT